MNRIERKRAADNFTVLSNDVFKASLSMRAMGLLCFIIHLPSDWKLYKTYLFKALPDGRTAIEGAWDELEAKGFILKVKETAGGKGKPPAFSYFVADFVRNVADLPVPNIQQPKDRQPKDRLPKTQQLLSTKEPSTTQQSTIELSTNEQDAAPAAAGTAPRKKRERVKKPEGEPKAPGIFQLFMDEYDRWFKELNQGVPPMINGASGNALKAVIAYCRAIAKKKAEPAILDEPALDAKGLDCWKYILSNWSKIDSFLQTKTRLIDIHSNIQNIITQIKNGHKQQQGGGAAGRAAAPTMADVASAIAGAYTGPHAGN